MPSDQTWLHVRAASALACAAAAAGRVSDACRIVTPMQVRVPVMDVAAVAGAAAAGIEAALRSSSSSSNVRLIISLSWTKSPELALQCIPPSLANVMG